MNGNALPARGDEPAVRFRQNCFVRALPGRTGAPVGLVRRGEALPYGGYIAPNGWLSVEYRGQRGWVEGGAADLSGV